MFSLQTTKVPDTFFSFWKVICKKAHKLNFIKNLKLINGALRVAISSVATYDRGYFVGSIIFVQYANFHSYYGFADNGLQTIMLSQTRTEPVDPPQLPDPDTFKSLAAFGREHFVSEDRLKLAKKEQRRLATMDYELVQAYCPLALPIEPTIERYLACMSLDGVNTGLTSRNPWLLLKMLKLICGRILRAKKGRKWPICFACLASSGTGQERRDRWGGSVHVEMLISKLLALTCWSSNHCVAFLWIRFFDMWNAYLKPAWKSHVAILRVSTMMNPEFEERSLHAQWIDLQNSLHNLKNVFFFFDVWISGKMKKKNRWTLMVKKTKESKLMSRWRTMEKRQPLWRRRQHKVVGTLCRTSRRRNERNFSGCPPRMFSWRTGDNSALLTVEQNTII